MKVVFITDQPVPNGMASTNRLLSLASGINENDCEVEVLVINPTESKEHPKNHTNSGYYKGVKYVYLTPSIFMPSGLYRKFMTYLGGLFNMLKVMRASHRKTKIDAVVILHTWSIYPILLYYFFIKSRKIVYLQERNEYPFIGKDKNIFRKMDYFIYTRWVLRLFDGLLLITRNLETYYSQFLNKKAITKVIPMTVEPERFGKQQQTPNENYIAYCGFMGGNKDGVYDLIRAFAKISPDYPAFRLYLIGDSKDQAEMQYLKDLASETGVADKVWFTGKIIRDEMPALLDNARILALSRPDSKQAEGGFPTKLGEYLATAKPVVVTRVGEIPEYLQNEVNAFLANPDDIDDFARQLRFVLEHENLAKEVGLKGKELAYTVFNYVVQGKHIKEFICQLQEKR